MSLMEGLLLEPPFPVGGAIQTISSLSHIGVVATATTASPHGYKNGDSVEISGVTGDGVQWWNGVFVVYGINEADPNTTVFKYQMAGSPPESSAAGVSKKVAKLSQMEVYIADLGENSPAGDGSITFPYNGSARPASGRYATKNITSLTKSGRIATATCSGHEFAAGDWVTVIGVRVKAPLDSTEADETADFYYMGTFVVKETTSSTFTYVMLATPYNSPAVPEVAGGSIQCWRERERFCEVMRGIPGNSLVVIGEGTFETKGGFEPGVSGGWHMKRRQRIVGSGIGITIIKLVSAYASRVSQQFSALVYNDNPELTGGVEVCDLSIDCNVDWQASKFSNSGALVCRHGKDIFFRRVELYNFGSLGPIGPYNENFPCFAAGRNVTNAVMDSCIARGPSKNNAHNSLCFNMGGQTALPPNNY